MAWVVLFAIIGRVGNGSPEMLGAGAGAPQDCGSGISIAQAMFEFMSNESVIIGGVPSSFTLRFPAFKGDVDGPEAGCTGTDACEEICAEDAVLVVDVFGGDFADLFCAFSSDSITGSFWPRSFPRLATPKPHVKVVLYPEHSRPRSRH